MVAEKLASDKDAKLDRIKANEKIAEINPDKFGSFTPGSAIVIVDEAVAKNEKPDYFLVLPWHFKEHILAANPPANKRSYKFVFPLPQLEIC